MGLEDTAAAEEKREKMMCTGHCSFLGKDFTVFDEPTIAAEKIIYSDGMVQIMCLYRYNHNKCGAKNASTSIKASFFGDGKCHQHTYHEE